MKGLQVTFKGHHLPVVSKAGKIYTCRQCVYIYESRRNRSLRRCVEASTRRPRINHDSVAIKFHSTSHRRCAATTQKHRNFHYAREEEKRVYERVRVFITGYLMLTTRHGLGTSKEGRTNHPWILYSQYGHHWWPQDFHDFFMHTPKSYSFYIHYSITVSSELNTNIRNNKIKIKRTFFKLQTVHWY